MLATHVLCHPACITNSSLWPPKVLVCSRIANICLDPFTIAHPCHRRRVRIVVGSAPGGSNDIAAHRPMTFGAAWLNITDNRPGASGNIAVMEPVVRSPPDGYTLVVLSSAVTTSCCARSRLLLPSRIRRSSRLRWPPQARRSRRAVPGSGVEMMSFLYRFFGKQTLGIPREILDQLSLNVIRLNTPTGRGARARASVSPPSLESCRRKL
jgi:hypothetical protein